MSDAEQAIRERAYALWEKEGSPPGRDMEFWERARLMLEAEQRGGGASPAGGDSPAHSAADIALDETFPASDPPSFAAPARTGAPS